MGGKEGRRAEKAKNTEKGNEQGKKEYMKGRRHSNEEKEKARKEKQKML
jgi:hypothetical protein